MPDVEPEEGELSVSFDGRSVTYGFGELDALVPAYAASIHKSQGSEYPAVIMTQHYAMLQRKLLYTGVTRGKRLVALVGQKKAIAIAVRNISGRRYTPNCCRIAAAQRTAASGQKATFMVTFDQSLELAGVCPVKSEGPACLNANARHCAGFYDLARSRTKDIAVQTRQPLASGRSNVEISNCCVQMR